ncbi:Hypothetical protein CAP_2616 [Chondromyces apiculatus DSM 436]|uniref:Uncharacterized protein n=1 Tax=Chondromyces apiculatus DSM 436 TaxID=1192034 RepID=A0A017TIT0_9BACT|nr:Hypothetical protein CAP_2616 [Chondromyces apiculatus DSM 436]
MDWPRRREVPRKTRPGATRRSDVHEDRTPGEVLSAGRR